MRGYVVALDNQIGIRENWSKIGERRITDFGPVRFGIGVADGG